MEEEDVYAPGGTIPRWKERKATVGFYPVRLKLNLTIPPVKFLTNCIKSKIKRYSLIGRSACSESDSGFGLYFAEQACSDEGHAHTVGLSLKDDRQFLQKNRGNTGFFDGFFQLSSGSQTSNDAFFGMAYDPAVAFECCVMICAGNFFGKRREYQ